MSQKQRSPHPSDRLERQDLLARDDVRVGQSPTRCPFCHDDCAPERSVACRDCLARHHRDCWDEGGVCAACGGASRFVTEARLKDLIDEHDVLAKLLSRRHTALYPHDAKSLRLMFFLQAASYGLGAVLAFAAPMIPFLLGVIAAICTSSVAWIVASRKPARRARLVVAGLLNAAAFAALCLLPAALEEVGALGPGWSTGGCLALAVTSVVAALGAPEWFGDEE